MNVLRMADQDLARQAGPDSRRSERPGRRRQGHQRRAHPRVAADHPAGARQGREGVPHLASRPSRKRACTRTSSRSRPVAARLSELLGKPVLLEEGLADRRRHRAGLGRAARERALQQGREEGQGRPRQADGRRCATCSSWTRSARRIAPRPRRTASASSPKIACAGPLLVGELEALERALAKPARPMVAIVAGSKVSTKLTVLEALLGKVDKLIVGGGIANTFLAATGVKVGKSLHEAEMLDMARNLLEQAKARGAEIPLPTDVVVAKEFAATAHADVREHSRRACRRDDSRHRSGYGRALRRAAADARARSSGTARWACSSSISSAKAPRPSPRRSRSRRRFRWPAAATRSRPSRSTASKKAFRTSRPAAARSSSSSRARRCPRWRCSKTCEAIRVENGVTPHFLAKGVRPETGPTPFFLDGTAERRSILIGVLAMYLRRMSPTC